MRKHLTDIILEDPFSQFKELVLTEYNVPVLNEIRDYLLEIPKQGLLLSGPVGTGKTLFTRCVCRSMYTLYNKRIPEFNAPFIRDNYYKDENTETYSIRYKLHAFRYVAIQDLGLEQTYSTGANIIQNILYDRFERGFITLCTTNLPPVELVTRYNDSYNRIADRFLAMFRVIEVKGESFR